MSVYWQGIVWPLWYEAIVISQCKKAAYRKVRKQRYELIRATKMAWKLFQTPYIRGLSLCWHFSPSVFEQIHEIQQRKQLTIHWSTETRSNQSSESLTCYYIMSFISLEQAFSWYCATMLLVDVKIPDIPIYCTRNLFSNVF